MLPFDADPVIAEASDCIDELRRVRLALRHTPPTTRSHSALLTERDRLTGRLEQLRADPRSDATIRAHFTERATIIRLALQAHREAGELQRAHEEAAAIVAAAVAADREMTAVERTQVHALRNTVAPEEWWPQVTSATRRDGILETLGTLRLREARTQLRGGLLLTTQMREIIAEARPALLRGDPVLLIGETGGAKTALAEYLSRHVFHAEPELVSGYGDITSGQVIGSHELRAENGATVSIFVPGPLLRGMIEGRPVILDEINAMPAEFLKRLNRILQLRPGDRFGVQEHQGREVTIAPGFAVIATANEHTPHRYRGIDRMSAELVNRFGANGYRVRYPDTGLPFDAFPAENALLAAAAIVDARGALPSHLSPDEVMRVARAAFISQQVFAGSQDAGFSEFVSTEREIDGRPGLDEAVLAPRTLVAIMHKVAGSGGEITLERGLRRFVESVMHAEDRHVLALIFESQGFHLR